MSKRSCAVGWVCMCSFAVGVASIRVYVAPGGRAG